MFNTLSTQLTGALNRFTGRDRLTEANMADTLDEIRGVLLEADVALPVVDDFIHGVREKALGQKVASHLRPHQFLIKLVHDELTHIMGEHSTELNLRTTPPAILLVAGLQGSGKTTTVAKLGHRLKTHDRRSVMVVSTDIHRPAAIDQLQTLAEQTSLTFFPSTTDQRPVDIVKAAIQAATLQRSDVLIIDTAGRLAIDEAMMQEIKQVHQASQPIETLLVVDSMTGQDAAHTAKLFNEALPITGVILTKADGDSRGGAALSIRHITGKPIKFMGVGEKVDALEIFHPERLASRILDMGDILTLIEEASQKVDSKKAEKLAKKMQKGQAFDLEDFLSQLKQLRSMGGVTKLLERLPGAGQLGKLAKNNISDELFVKMEAMIQSMTPQERHFPDLIKGRRALRIAKGSGTQPNDLKKLLKQFQQMQKMMKQFSGKKMQKLLSMMPKGQFPNMPF